MFSDYYENAFINYPKYTPVSGICQSGIITKNRDKNSSTMTKFRSLRRRSQCDNDKQLSRSPILENRGAAQTVKELPNERFRREEKCEREPSGFPFTFHNPAAADKIACNFEASLSGILISWHSCPAPLIVCTTRIWGRLTL